MKLDGIIMLVIMLVTFSSQAQDALDTKLDTLVSKKGATFEDSGKFMTMSFWLLTL